MCRILIQAVLYELVKTISSVLGVSIPVLHTSLIRPSKELGGNNPN